MPRVKGGAKRVCPSCTDAHFFIERTAVTMNHVQLQYNTMKIASIHFLPNLLAMEIDLRSVVNHDESVLLRTFKFGIIQRGEMRALWSILRKTHFSNAGICSVEGPKVWCSVYVD